MLKSAVKIIEDIILHELDIPSNYGNDSHGNMIPSIITRDQNIILGNTDKLQITVGLVNVIKVISSTNVKDMNANPPTETQRVLVQENYQIDLQSKNNDARDRNWEIIAAISSIYAVQQMEKYGFKIFRSSSGFVNTGAAEGASNINRFSIVITAHVWYNKTKEIIDYYDTFPVRVDSEETVLEEEGMIEFNAEIDPEI